MRYGVGRWSGGLCSHGLPTACGYGQRRSGDEEQDAETEQCRRRRAGCGQRGRHGGGSRRRRRSELDGDGLDRGAGPFAGSSGQTLTCDGETVNDVTITVTPDSGSGPFHGGNASAIATAFHATGDSCGEGCVTNIQTESADTGWVTISLRG